MFRARFLDIDATYRTAFLRKPLNTRSNLPRTHAFAEVWNGPVRRLRRSIREGARTDKFGVPSSRCGRRAASLGEASPDFSAPTRCFVPALASEFSFQVAD